MFMFLAKYTDASDVIIGPAADGEAALRQLVVHGITKTPARLMVLQEGIVCAEVLWSDNDDALRGDDFEADDEADANPANYAEGGIVLEPSDMFADYLEAEATASNAVAGVAALQVAATLPAPTDGEDSGG